MDLPHCGAKAGVDTERRLAADMVWLERGDGRLLCLAREKEMSVTDL